MMSVVEISAKGQSVPIIRGRRLVRAKNSVGIGKREMIIGTLRICGNLSRM